MEVWNDSFLKHSAAVLCHRHMSIRDLRVPEKAVLLLDETPGYPRLLPKYVDGGCDLRMFWNVICLGHGKACSH
jgi:hypothetical protein